MKRKGMKTTDRPGQKIKFCDFHTENLVWYSLRQIPKKNVVGRFNPQR